MRNRQPKHSLAMVFSSIYFCLAFCNRAFAGGSGYGLFVGPPQLGAGQANPITFQNINEYKIVYISPGGLETNLAVTGFTLGQRASFKSGAYVSLGAGLILDANGVGPGLATSFGIEFGCLGACLALEYSQGVGANLSKRGVVSPSSLRLGVVLWTD